MNKVFHRFKDTHEYFGGTGYAPIWILSILTGTELLAAKQHFDLVHLGVT